MGFERGQRVCFILHAVAPVRIAYRRVVFPVSRWHRRPACVCAGIVTARSPLAFADRCIGLSASVGSGGLRSAENCVAVCLCRLAMFTSLREGVPLTQPPLVVLGKPPADP